jgi:large subunit ribosomal protein L22
MMMTRDWVSSARVRYLGTSAQKTRLVVDLIRGKNVAEALTTLRYTRKTVAIDVSRTIDAAIANARQKKDVDLDRLYVHTAFVDGGPSLKRVRPAPMGRAFRVLKRLCHVTIGLGERPAHDAVPQGTGEAKEASPASKHRKTKSARRVSAPRKAAARSKRARAKRKPTKRTGKKRS